MMAQFTQHISTYPAGFSSLRVYIIFNTEIFRCQQQTDSFINSNSPLTRSLWSLTLTIMDVYKMWWAFLNFHQLNAAMCLIKRKWKMSSPGGGGGRYHSEIMLWWYIIYKSSSSSCHFSSSFLPPFSAMGSNGMRSLHISLMHTYPAPGSSPKCRSNCMTKRN